MKERKPVYSNDKTAPRMRKGEFTTTIVTKTLWKQFLKEHPEHSGMTWATFFHRWMEIAEIIREETVKNPLGVKLGSYNGELKTQYLPYKFEGINQPLSNELGEKVKHTNLVNKGKIAKIKWERRWAVKFNKMLQFFAFDPVREINVIANKYIDENPEKLRIARNTLGGHSVWRTKRP